MNKTKARIGGAVLAVAVAGYAVAGGPLAADKLRRAVAAQDADAVIALVDFDSLRSDIRSEFADANGGVSDPFFNAIVEETVLPSNVEMAMMGGLQMMDTNTAAFSDPSGLSVDGMRLGFLTFEVTLDTPGAPLGLIFAPRGLGWKLVGVDIGPGFF